MHPYISQALSAERARDLRSRAARDRLARQVRQARHRTTEPVRPAAAAPDTYEEFLLRTSGPVTGRTAARETAGPEPAAAGRPGRHSIR